ncbi:hypothetical protein ACWEOE_32165 [Amycolatopsis sp. NPDC004368]
MRVETLTVANGDPVESKHIADALTAGRFAYDDGSTQVFEPGGSTTNVDRGRLSEGEWYVDDDGRFCSFWPPTHRACFDLHWLVDNGKTPASGSPSAAGVCLRRALPNRLISATV